MKALLKLRVVDRLRLGFGLMAGLLVLVSGVGLFNAHRVQGVVQDQLQAFQMKQTLAARMLAAATTQDLDIRNIGLLSDPVAMQTHAKEARGANKALLGAIDEFKALAPDAAESELLQHISDITAKNLPAVEEAVGLAVSFQPEDAVKVINERIDPLSKERRGQVNKLADMQHERVIAASQQLASSSTQAGHIMLAAGALGLLVAVIAAVVVSRSIVIPLKIAVNAANRVADGDLTVQLKATSQDEIGELVGAMSVMSDKLRKVIGTMRDSAESIFTASSEIASGNQDLSERTERQASSLQSTVSTVIEMGESTKRNAESARMASHLAVQASSIAAMGGDRVGQVVQTMNEITDSSRKISDIVSVIDGIAFQTNILALNAAVEAARAGEQGRGFAVVASEVRSLAQRSANAAKEIKTLINNNVEKVTVGSQLVDEAGATMAEIVESSQKVVSIVAEITEATDAQAHNLQSVNQAIGQIEQTTQQNAALVEQAAAAAGSLQHQTRSLNEAVSIFRVQHA